MSERAWTLTVALVSVAVGFVFSYGGTWLRDWLKARAERTLLAGALASELQSFLDACPTTQQAVISCGLTPSSIAVYTASGQRLYLLGTGLVDEVVSCYFAVQAALAELEKAGSMTADAGVQPRVAFGGERRSDAGATRAREQAVEVASRALQSVQAVLPKLNKAAGRNGERGVS